MSKWAVIGCGNMAKAIFQLADTKKLELYFYNPNFAKAQALADKTGGMAVESIDDLPVIDYLFLSHKPQQLTEVALAVQDKKIKGVISILAGINVNTLQRHFKKAKDFIRLMPNTPSMIGEGVNLLFADKNSAEKKTMLSFLSNLGKTIDLESEEKIDFFTPISGSGPGYIFEFMHLYDNYLRLKGVEAKLSQEMILNTFLGSLKLAKESGASFEELRNQVTSKKGVTQRGLEVFKEEGLERLITKSLDEAAKRLKDLSP